MTKNPRNMRQQGLSWNIAITDLKRKPVGLLISVCKYCVFGILVFGKLSAFRDLLVYGSGIMEQAHADFNNEVLALSNLQIAPEGTPPVHYDVPPGG